MIPFSVHPEVAPLVRIGVIEVAGVRVASASPELRAEAEALAARIRAAHAGKEPAAIEALQPARDLYRRTGVDPTKLRPSSEALLRRVLRGEALPEINSLVDTSNLCSVEFLLPIGLHDLGAVSGGLTLRRGAPGEGYEAIGKGWYGVEGRLTVADAVGPCGSPTSDSRRTMITPATTRALMVIYGPAATPAGEMEAHARKAAGRIERFSGGTLVGTAVLP